MQQQVQTKGLLATKTKEESQFSASNQVVFIQKTLKNVKKTKSKDKISFGKVISSGVRKKEIPETILSLGFPITNRKPSLKNSFSRMLMLHRTRI